MRAHSTGGGGGGAEPAHATEAYRFVRGREAGYQLALHINWGNGTDGGGTESSGWLAGFTPCPSSAPGSASCAC